MTVLVDDPAGTGAEAAPGTETGATPGAAGRPDTATSRFATGSGCGAEASC